MGDGENTVRRALERAQSALAELLEDRDGLARIAALGEGLASCLHGGGKVLACGNGGSLCDAAHFAEELTGRFRADRPALAAIALADAGHITCAANDYGFEHIFSRAVEALGRPGDVLIVLSTSGNSANLVNAAHAAAGRGMASAALLGRGGGRLGGVCEHEIIVPGETGDRVQELHMLILHALVEDVERRLFGAAEER